ncbi:MAG: amidohydrolase family protein [Planctomycetaceae bacterium]|nr:amidohydrolase family protein [Planctomycetaceae bacterium]
MNRPQTLPLTALRIALLYAFCVCGGPLAAQDSSAKPSDKKTTDAQKAESAKSSPAEKTSAARKTPANRKATAPPVTLAITNATVHTMTSQGVIKNATILISGKRITAVGGDVSVPEKVRQIDAGGQTVAPGLIDCRSSLWLARDSVSSASSSGSLKAVDGIDTFSDSWIEVARQGVTTVAVQPSGSLGGQGAVLRVAPVDTVEELLVTKDAPVQASLGLSGKTGNTRDRYLQYEALKKTLTAAKAYKEAWKKYEEALKKSKEKKPAKDAKTADKKPETKPESRPQPPAGTGGRRVLTPEMRAEIARRMQMARGGTPTTKPSTSSTSEPKKPTKDPVKELLVRVLDGELSLRLEAHRADDVAHALKLAEDFKLTFVLEGLTKAGRTWSSVQEQHPPIVAGPFVSYESTPSYASSAQDRYDELHEVDGLIAIGSFSKDARGSRLLRMHAAAAIAGGMSPEKALRAVTIDAARLLGIDKDTGSIATGKLADLIIVAGHPLDPAASIALTVSNGEITHEAEHVSPVSTVPLVEVPASIDLPQEYLLKSTRVLQADGTLAVGTVHVKSGRIAKNGAKADENLPVIDLGGAVITPGLIIGHYAGASASTTDPVTPHVRATDSFSPTDERLEKLTDTGFTSVLLAPGSQSVVAGQIGCVRISGNSPILASKKGPQLPASKFVLSSASRSRNRFPAALSGQLQVLDAFFSGQSSASSLYVPEVVQRRLDAQQTALLKSLKGGRTAALMEASSAAEVEAALTLADRFQLRALILNPQDLDGAAELLKTTKAGLVVRTSQISDHDWYAQQIAAASRAGSRICVTGTDGAKIRQTLAVLVNAGMSPEAALRSVTTDAADAYQLKTVGRLSAGSVADIVIWNGSPLDPAARPIHVIVDGQSKEIAE